MNVRGCRGSVFRIVRRVVVFGITARLRPHQTADRQVDPGRAILPFIISKRREK